MQSRLNVYVLHANSTYLVKVFCLIARLFVKSNEVPVAQLNSKFRLTLNWTLLRLFDFVIIAQIIVRLMMDLTNACAVNMIVMKYTA